MLSTTTRCQRGWHFLVLPCCATVQSSRQHKKMFQSSRGSHVAALFHLKKSFYCFILFLIFVTHIGRFVNEIKFGDSTPITGIKVCWMITVNDHRHGAVMVGHPVRDQEVAGLVRTWQVVHTRALSPSSTIWFRPKGCDAVQLQGYFNLLCVFFLCLIVNLCVCYYPAYGCHKTINVCN